MKIICVGRNYINHIQELNNNIPKEPLLFLKPDTAIQPKGHPFFIPDFSDDIHFEIEIVIKMIYSYDSTCTIHHYYTISR